MDYQSELHRYQQMIEQALNGCFSDRPAHAALYDAMRYSLLAGGKRIRPVLTLAFCKAAGGREENALPLALAIEMVHTYSLIHDDLPSMDNDDLRRGRPTNHKVYGEDTAILAGDALQSAAFARILSAPELSPQRRAEAALVLARAAGEDGMVAGQILDMEGERRALNVEEIGHMNALKTGCLLEAACVMGVIAAGGSEAQQKAARDYAAAVGLAFQVRDDVLDVTSTSAEMGKTVGKDEQQNKSTYVSLLGLEKCHEVIAQQTALARRALENMGLETDFIYALADDLAGRDH